MTRSELHRLACLRISFLCGYEVKMTVKVNPDGGPRGVVAVWVDTTEDMLAAIEEDLHKHVPMGVTVQVKPMRPSRVFVYVLHDWPMLADLRCAHCENEVAMDRNAEVACVHCGGLDLVTVCPVSGHDVIEVEAGLPVHCSDADCMWLGFIPEHEGPPAPPEPTGPDLGSFMGPDAHEARMRALLDTPSENPPWKKK